MIFVVDPSYTMYCRLPMYVQIGETVLNKLFRQGYCAYHVSTCIKLYGPSFFMISYKFELSRNNILTTFYEI
jgi:hypothetical protein